MTNELDEQVRKERRRISGLAQVSQECSREHSSVEAKLGETERELRAVKAELEEKAREIQRLAQKAITASAGKHSNTQIEGLRKLQEAALQAEKKLLDERDLILKERDGLFSDYQRSQDVSDPRERLSPVAESDYL